MSEDTAAAPEKSGSVKIIKKGSGKFPPGTSGNLLGRPKGSRNKTTLVAQALFDGDVEKIYQVVRKLAIEEEYWPALKASLDRILPPAKSTPLAFQMPPLETLDDLVVGHLEVIDALSRGDITPEDARALENLLDGTRRILASADLADRVAALESLVGEVK